jgi:hypothetical protein
MKPTSTQRPQALSERLGPLTRAQLQAALDWFDLGRLIDVRATTSGLFGQNVFLTAESGEWVLRGAPHWPWQFAKERFYVASLRRIPRAESQHRDRVSLNHRPAARALLHS